VRRDALKEEKRETMEGREALLERKGKREKRESKRREIFLQERCYRQEEWDRILAATRLSVKSPLFLSYTSCHKEIKMSTDVADAVRIWRRLVT
jgi:hypothetical protein